MKNELPNYNKKVGGYVVFNKDGKTAITNDGTKGGYFYGDSHQDPSNGISAIVDNDRPILVEGNEVIINKKTVQSEKVLTVKGTPKEILSTLNQMDGNGVAIGDEEAEILAKYRTGGKIPREKQMYLGKEGGSNVSPKGMFESAVQMENEGIDSETIRSITGWFRNPFDKLWRFEISDREAKINLSKIVSTIKKVVSSKSEVTLSLKDVYTNNELSKAYGKSIEELPFMFYYDEEYEGLGSLNIIPLAGKVFIKLNVYEFLRGNVGEVESTVAERGKLFISFTTHELQHAIQIREGLSAGGSVEQEYRKLLKEHKGVSERKDRAENNRKTREDVLLEQARLNYLNHLGEIEASDSDVRKFFDKKTRIEIPPYSLINFNNEEVIVIPETKIKFDEGGKIPREKQMYLGKEGGSNVSPKGMFESAVQMENEGIDSETIRSITGWFRSDLDGLWRYEISDNEMEIICTFTDKEIDSLKTDEDYFYKDLKDVIKHDELFKAYPRIKYLRVFFMNVYDKPEASLCTTEKGKIFIICNLKYERAFSNNRAGVEELGEREISDNRRSGEERKAKRYNTLHFRKVITHELQHAIQVNEGLAKGGSESFELEKLKSDSRTIHSLTEKEQEYIAIKRFLNKAGEIEAMSSDARIDYNDLQRIRNKPYSEIAIDPKYFSSDLETKIKFRTGGSVPIDINKLSLNEFEKYLEEKYNSKVELGDYKKYIYLSRIEVDKETRGLGIGSEIMSEIIDYADYNDKKITLTPSTDYGASSVARLKDFYKKFGFVENKGRNKDFEISQLMYRVPVDNKLKQGGELIKRADGSYSRRGLYDNIRDNVGSGRKPTKQMLEQEAKIRDKYHLGGDMTPSELKAFYDSPEGKKLDAQTYSEWNKLVNMTKSELEKFYNSVEGKKAGLSPEEAKEQGIDSGRESARWVLKMKDIPYTQWTSDMWRWAKKQINFIKRMSGMKGSLYNDKGEKTRKHTALLIWGHNPEQKFAEGGSIGFKEKQLEIINRTNPAPNNYNTWIRNVEDIKTAEEAFSVAFEDGAMYPDFETEDMNEAIESGFITIYSSYPIKDGVFITPSKMNAQDYAGGKGGKIYSKKVSINDVAWIDESEGQFASVTEQKFKGGGDIKGYDNFKNPILINGFISNKKIDGKEIFLITYNSGGQEGLNVHQTMNPLAMLDAVEKKTGLHTNTLQVFIYEHTENSNRIETEDELEFLKDNYTVIIVDRDSVEFYNGHSTEQKFAEGGGIGDEVELELYQVRFDTDDDSEIKLVTTSYEDAKYRYDSTTMGDFGDSEFSVSLEKKIDKYKFIYELDEDESIEDYPIEEYYDDSYYYELTEEGEFDNIENRVVESYNYTSNDLLNDVENWAKNKFGNYKYNRIDVYSEDDTKEENDSIGSIQLRIADHSQNESNLPYGIDRSLSVVIANKDATRGRFQQNRPQIYFDGNDSFDYVISEIENYIEDAKEDIQSKKFEKGGRLRKFKGGGELSKKALAVETNDLTDFVRKYFIKDGRIDVRDAMQELFGNRRGKSIADEYGKRIGLHKKGGLTISQLAHNLWEEHRDEVREDIDDSDFRNAVEEVLLTEYGVASMIKNLMKKSSEGEQDRENEYWMNQFDEGDDEYYEDLSDEEVADYFKDMEGFERELAKGTEHEMEHLETLKKVAEGKVTPEEAVVQTSLTHIKENPNYYEDLAEMEKENEDIVDLYDFYTQGYENTAYQFGYIPDFNGAKSIEAYSLGSIDGRDRKTEKKSIDELEKALKHEQNVTEQEESIPDLIEGLKVLADSLEGAEKKEIEDVIEGLEILLESLEGEEKKDLEDTIEGLKLLL